MLGVQQWEARYNGPGNSDDEAYFIAVDSNGNVYVTGRSIGNGTSFDFATIKYNSAGVMQWVARYNGPGNGSDWAKVIEVDDEGNVYVTGQSSGAGTSSDYATIKYDANGIEQWVARYDGAGSFDAANALALDQAGNVYVTGGSAASLTPDEADFAEDFDYATIKYDENGKEIWVKRYDGPIAGNLYDEANALAVDPSGNVYVTGRSVGSPAEDLDGLDYATIKYDANGNEQWLTRYNGPANSVDVPLSLALDAGNNVFVTGLSAAEPESENHDYATIGYDANGNVLWVARYNGPANSIDQAVFVTVDSAGNVYVTGRSVGIGTEFDIATIKYNSTGVEQWVVRYNGPANGYDASGSSITSHPLAVDESGNVYVTGTSLGIGSDVDYVTIKYSQLLFACGKNNDKVLICHKGKKTLCISNSDVADHIAHGDQMGECAADSAVTVISERTDVSGLTTALPARLRIFNAPNPVSAITKISYELPVDGNVSLKVYDMLGREIASLVNGGRKAGHYSLYFDASTLQKGVYNYRLTLTTKTKIWVQTMKMPVIK